MQSASQVHVPHIHSPSWLTIKLQRLGHFLHFLLQKCFSFSIEQKQSPSCPNYKLHTLLQVSSLEFFFKEQVFHG